MEKAIFELVEWVKCLTGINIMIGGILFYIVLFKEK